MYNLFTTKMEYVKEVTFILQAQEIGMQMEVIITTNSFWVGMVLVMFGLISAVI